MADAKTLLWAMCEHIGTKPFTKPAFSLDLECA